MKHKKIISTLVSLSLVISGCAALTEEQRETIARATGAVGGGVIAAIASDSIGNPALRAAVIITGAAVGAYIGDQFAKALSERDQKKLFVAQQQAAGSGEEVSFSGDDGVRGRVSVVKDKPTVKQEKKITVKHLKDKVEQTPALSLVGAAYSPRSTTNVRSGPGTDYKVVDRLTASQSVQVIGEALPGKKWYLISQLEDGTASGYVYSSLMLPSNKPISYIKISTDSTSAAVSEAQVQASGICKTVRQEITTADGTISEDIRVCQQGNGTWKMA